MKRGRREVFLRGSRPVIGVYRGCQFGIVQWKGMGGAGRQEAGKTWSWKALLADKEVGLDLRNHLANLRGYQMGSDEARFVFWNDCSGGRTDLS